MSVRRLSAKKITMIFLHIAGDAITKLIKFSSVCSCICSIFCWNGCRSGQLSNFAAVIGIKKVYPTLSGILS